MPKYKRSPTDHPDIVLYSNGIYYARLWIDKRDKEVSLKTKSFIDAKRLLKERIREIDPHGSKGGLTVGDVIEEFLEGKSKLLSLGKNRNGTFEEYTRLFQLHLLPFFKFKNIKDITAELWEQYCDRKEGMALRNHYKVFNNFLKWCVSKKYINGIPILSYPEYESSEGMALTNEQILAVLGEVKTQKLMVFCLMYLYMAMRSREITALSWSRVHFDKDVIFLDKEHTKTKKSRWVPMHPTVKLLLIEMKSKSKSPVVFPMRGSPSKPMCNTGIYRSFNTAKNKAGIDGKISPHDFRHTWTTEAHNDPKLTDAQREDFAGSSSLVQKSTYVHNRIERLRPLANVVKVKGIEKLVANLKSDQKSLGTLPATEKGKNEKK